MRIVKTYVFFTAVWCCFIATGQVHGQEKPTIGVLSKSVDEGVVVRWAPTTPVAWQLGNQYGYTVTRYTLADTDSLAFTEKKVLTPSGLQVLPELDWEPLARQEKWGAIAAQAIYGDDFVLTEPTEGPASFMNESAEIENRFSFALLAADVSAPVAEAMALRWLDRDVVRGNTYVYRVELNGTHENYPVERGNSKITHTSPKALPRPSEVEANFGDHSVDISWNTFYLRGIYTSYLIERSDDGGKTFFLPDELQFFTLQREGAGPLQKMHYLDSLPNNEQVYYYRVKGITPFGETGPPSEAVSGQGIVALGDAVPVIRETLVMKDGTVTLTWAYPESLQPLLERVTVSRGPKASGPFEEIASSLSPATAQYNDAAPGPINYYQIKVYSKNGEVRQSFPAMVQLEDSIPPAVPYGLEGEIDKTGVVTLKWSANSEPDLYGYRVFRSNSTHEEYVQISQAAITAPAFRDSVNINTLTEEVVYTITAQDRRYNQSDYAQPLVLKRPDIVPPAKPVLKALAPLPGSLRIEWHPSPSADLAFYKLYRKKSNSNIWKEFIIPKDSAAYTDKLEDTEVNYDYSLIAIDDDQLASEAIQFSGKPLARELSTLSEITSTADRENHSIALSWEYPMAHDEIIIYRSENDGPLRRYAVVDSMKNSFEDKNLKRGGIYTYRFRVVRSNTGESGLSKAFKVIY